MSDYKIIDTILCRACCGQGVIEDSENQASTPQKCDFCRGAGYFLVVTNGKGIKEMITLTLYQASRHDLDTNHSS